jgi:hypothetical protein
MEKKRGTATNLRPMSLKYQENLRQTRGGSGSMLWPICWKWRVWRQVIRRLSRMSGSNRRTISRSGTLYTEPLKQLGRWVAVGPHPEFHLLGADRIAQIEIDMGGEVVHLVAERRELFLQRDPVVA